MSYKHPDPPSPNLIGNKYICPISSTINISSACGQIKAVCSSLCHRTRVCTKYITCFWRTRVVNHVLTVLSNCTCTVMSQNFPITWSYVLFPIPHLTAYSAFFLDETDVMGAEDLILS